MTKNDGIVSENRVLYEATASSSRHVPTSGTPSGNFVPPENAVRRPFPVIVDLTFGDGFHSKAILEEFREEEDLILFAVDRDPKAVELAQALKDEETRKVIPIHSRYVGELPRLGMLCSVIMCV